MAEKKNKTTTVTYLNYDLCAFEICIKFQWLAFPQVQSHQSLLTIRNEVRIQSSIRYRLPQWTCIALGKTEKYIEYICSFSKKSTVPISRVCTRGFSIEQMNRSKIPFNGKLRPYLWDTEVVFSFLIRTI